jgi:hypothetical protein
MNAVRIRPLCCFLLGSILWFDPRREHSSAPTAKSRGRRAQGLSRLAAPSRPPAGLGLDWSEHGGMLDRIGAAGDPHPIRKFKPVILSEIHTAAKLEQIPADVGHRLYPAWRK